MSDTKAIDVLSERFADFALDEMESETRTAVRLSLNGQEFTARILGFGSSFADSGTHTGHIPGTPPARGERCAACRWADVAILKTDVMQEGKPMYAILPMGKTVLEGEKQRVRPVWTTEALEVLKNIAVSGRDRSPEGSASYRRIPMPNATAFRYAAHVDAQLGAVLIEYDDAIPDFRDNAPVPGF